MTPPTTLTPPPPLVAGAGHGLGVVVAQLGQAAVGQAGQAALEPHQRVVADVEAEHLLLEGQPERLVELGVRDGDPGVGEPGRLALGRLLQGGEEGHDPGVVLAAPLEGAVDDLLEGEAQALAGVAHGVEGAGLDQRLDGPLVEHLGVDPLAEVVEVGERAAGLPLGHDEGHQGLADVAHRGQAEGDGAGAVARGADVALAGGEVGGELGQGAVDVGDQHLDAERPALAEVDGGLVLVVLDRGEQAGQVLDRVVGLQPGRLVGDEAVAVGVRLVEGVVGEGLDDVEEGGAELLAVALGRRSPATNFSRSAWMRARIFLPQALRRLSASASV